MQRKKLEMFDTVAAIKAVDLNITRSEVADSGMHKDKKGRVRIRWLTSGCADR